MTVLVSTHLTEFDRPQPLVRESSPDRYPFGCCSTRSIEFAHADTMKTSTTKCVRTCAFAAAPDSPAPLDAAKNMRQPGGAHIVRLRCTCSAPVGCAAGPAGRAVWGKWQAIRMRQAWGASVKQFAWVEWWGSVCITLFAACPPGAAGGTCAWRISPSKPAHTLQACQAWSCAWMACSKPHVMSMCECRMT